jgi:plastocyanin
MPNIARASLAVLLGLALVSVGCGTGADFGANGSAPATGSTAGTLPVVMKSLEFTPTTLRAHVGETVVWTNQDEAPHNVTYVSGPRFTSSRPTMNLGAKFRLRLTGTGTIHYVCTIHPWMKATLVVSP